MPKSKKRQSDFQPTQPVNTDFAASSSSLVPADWQWERSLEFQLLGARVSGLNIKITEVEGGLKFDLSVLEGAPPRPDIQALFFNMTDHVDLSSLDASGEKVSGFKTGKLNDLGYGLNVRGQTSLFDVGVGLSPRGKEGINTYETSFIISSNTAVLTLDDIGGMEFGARVNGIGGKPVLVDFAPFAPDAVNDNYTIYEDGVNSADVSSNQTQAVMLTPLDNDTDGDGDTLTIIETRGASHGTVEIIDGDDADQLPGDAVLYTPNQDFSGVDTFEYLISDGNGGLDYASVEVTVDAVADKPGIHVEILGTSQADQMILKVSGQQTDLDQSEFMDRIELSATSADGAVIDLSPYVRESLVFNPDSDSTDIYSEFLLDLPDNISTLFDLHIDVVSKEQSNGDEERASETIRVETVQHSTVITPTFQARDQSIWSNGDVAQTSQAYEFGVSKTFEESSVGWSLNGGGALDLTIAGTGVRTDFTTSISTDPINIDFKVRNTLDLKGGKIDADIRYNGKVDTLYNKTIDQLQFTTSATPDMANSTFSASSPTFEFETFIKELAIKGGLTINSWGYVTFNAGNTSAGTVHFGIAPPNDSIGLDIDLNVRNAPSYTADGLSIARFDGNKLVILDQFNVDKIEKTKKDVLGNELFTGKAEAPVFTTTKEGVSQDNTVMFGDNFDPFITMTYDLDGILASVFKKPNPVSKEYTVGSDPVSLGVKAELIDLDLVNPFSFELDHLLRGKDVSGTLLFENGMEHAFTFGDTFLFEEASVLDANKDGVIEYSMIMDAAIDLTTKAGPNIGFQDQLDILKAQVTATSAGKFTLGPALGFDGTIVDENISITAWEDTFALATGSLNVDGLVA